jgi:hypothetical protein
MRVQLLTIATYIFSFRILFMMKIWQLYLVMCVLNMSPKRSLMIHYNTTLRARINSLFFINIFDFFYNFLVFISINWLNVFLINFLLNYFLFITNIKKFFWNVRFLILSSIFNFIRFRYFIILSAQLFALDKLFFLDKIILFRFYYFLLWNNIHNTNFLFINSLFGHLLECKLLLSIGSR